ncbi:MAG: hypothetical protein ABI761_02815 [Saprospiraceae bacterium]
MKKNIYSLLKNKIPLFILLIWTAAIGYFIWQRVNQSGRPPIFDALTYYQKAKNSWMNLHQGFPQNPLNVDQATRPPGTVLLSYPFGFHEDYHGFLFRSVFVPFLLWIITILILVWPKREPNKERSYWSVILAVFLLGPFPFFFQFDFGSSAYWGLVDSFLASMSALALAVVVKSLEKRSRTLLIIGVLIASICPFIKPSGCFIYFLTALCWSMLCFVPIFNKSNQDNKALIRFWRMGSILFFIMGILILYLVKSSSYLGNNTVSGLTKNMLILNDESKNNISLPFFLSLLYETTGPQILIIASVFIFLISKSKNKMNEQIPLWVLCSSSFLFFMIGMWFWIWMTGITQVRYFFPFFLLGLVPLIYASHQMLSSQDARPHPLLYLVSKCVFILPAINMLLLLSIINPNNYWQKKSGTSMNIKLNDPGVNMAKQFLSLIANEKTQSTVYDTNFGDSNNSFVSFGYLDRIIHPELNGFTNIHPVDWVRPSTFRFTEIILKSNYIIFRPMKPDEITQALKDSIISSFGEEEIAIEAYLNSLTLDQGLQTVYQEEDCKLSKITDKTKLIEAFEPFLMSKQWRPLFLQENKITPQGWKLFQSSE